MLQGLMVMAAGTRLGLLSILSLVGVYEYRVPTFSLSAE